MYLEFISSFFIRICVSVSVSVFVCVLISVFLHTKTHMLYEFVCVCVYSFFSIYMYANEMYIGYCPFDLVAHTIYPPHGKRDGDDDDGGGGSGSKELRVASMYG